MAAGPLATLGTYQVWHGRGFDTKIVAELYVKTTRRGNPVLADATEAALFQRGEEMAMHCRDSLGYWVITEKSGRPVGVYFSWDLTDPPHFTQDSSMAVQSAILGAVDKASEPRLACFEKGKVLYSAYGGFLPGTPRHVVVGQSDLIAHAHLAAGWTHFFGVAVHPTVIRVSAKIPAAMKWQVHYNNITAPHGTRPVASVGAGYCVVELLPFEWMLTVMNYDPTGKMRELCPLPSASAILDFVHSLREPCVAELGAERAPGANPMVALLGGAAKL